MATVPKHRLVAEALPPQDWSAYLPEGILPLANPQTALPAMARDPAVMARIRAAVRQMPSEHRLHCGDAREMRELAPASVHLVLTSPPYWTLKEYRPHAGQLGHIAAYERFLAELDRVWLRCFDALVPGGRLICVVGDVCLSRRKNAGRHTVVPLHAAIQERCRTMGYDNLAPIIWHKIANAAYEVEGSGGGFLGKPYEPNAVVKNDIEFILMERKPGGYRAPSLPARILSLLAEDEHRIWFQQIWTGLTGASTRSHPAPYPLELAERLVRMFSFAGDTVLDPFLGSGTTTLAAGLNGRNSVGYEIDPHYYRQAGTRIAAGLDSLFGRAVILDSDHASK
ncbi:MAG TPA: site-specific DNA-methyltransferase [Terriglobales bacterium]|nr:site-specific DNA-methyltransferase [Terriglobales bacterium]